MSWRRNMVVAIAAVALAAVGVTLSGGGAAPESTARAAASGSGVTIVVPGAPDQPLRGNVTLTADAQAPVGASIVSVQFQSSPAGADTWSTIGTSFNAPYQFDFDTTTLTAGDYDIRAVATDSAGGVRNSAPAPDRVLANNVTFVALADPGAILAGKVTLVATREEGGAAPVSVTFERSAAGAQQWTTIGTATPELDDAGTPTGRYTTELDAGTLSDGRYDLRAVMNDPADAGQFVAGAIRGRLVDTTPPTAALADPGSPLHGVVALSATAQDDGAGVTSVRFERSPAGAGAWKTIGSASRAPFTRSFDTRLVDDGHYDLRAISVDGAGNRGSSAVVRDVAIANAAKTRSDGFQIENVVAPAQRIALLGAIAGDAQHEAWAYGFTNAAPASVNGTPLPYTSTGDDQLVLLRYTDTDGWQIADVLRNADGTAYPLSPGAALAVTGQMAPSGEAWIALRQQVSGGPPDVGLFHRRPGAGFVNDDAAAAAMGSLLGPAANSLGATRLRLRQTPAGEVYGLLTAPQQTTRIMQVTAAGGPQQVLARLDYGLLVNGAWSMHTASPPPTLSLQRNDTVDLAVADPAGPGAAWAALKAKGASPMILGHVANDAWNFATTGLDALDGANAFRGTARLRADGSGVWIGANSGEVVARYDDTSGQASDSWCAAGAPAGGCSLPLDPDHPAAVPDGVFDTSEGRVALSLEPNFVDVYSHGDWSRVAAPGFAPGEGRALFVAPDDGWLAGEHALGHIVRTTRRPPLASWPQANRSPLTSVALAPGSSGATAASGALAVGLDGTTLRYDSAAGWQVAPTPSRARRVALRGVAFSGPSTAAAVGQLGTILRWDGTSWSEDPQSVAVTQSQLNAVAFAANGEGWAVGAFGTILHYDGTSWAAEKPPKGDEGVTLTSVAVAGGDVFAVDGGNLITRGAGGQWRRVARTQLPTPAPADGTLRLVAGLADGGVVAAGRSVVVVRDGPGQPFSYSPQPIEGIAVALAGFREEGAVRAFVSVAPSVSIDGNDTHDVGGFPPGDGDLLRQTKSGWNDLSGSQYPGAEALGDGAVKADPVLAVATNAAGSAAWAVGGYAGTVTAAGLGTDQVLPARPAGWRTSAVWRYDNGGSAESPALSQSEVSLPAKSATVSFAYFSSPLCRIQCTAVRDAQPDVNTDAAATQIAAFARQPGGPSFAVLGGNARGPIEDGAYASGRGAFDLARLPTLLAPLGKLPLFAAYGPRDSVPTESDPSRPWAEAFAQAPAPFGRASAPQGISPGSGGSPAGAVNRYYAFDASQNGGTLRVIVLDNAEGSLEAAAAGQTAWLDGQLAAARDGNLPVVVIAARPLRAGAAGGAGDGAELAARLADAGVLGVFTTSGTNWRTQLDQRVLVPEDAASGAPQIPEYEGATLGYQQPQNNGVLWYSVSVDTAARKLRVDAIPVMSSLALKPLSGLSVARSATLSFEAVGRRPTATIATQPSDDTFPGFDSYVGIPAQGCGTCVGPSYAFNSSDPTIGDFVVPSGPGSRFPKLDAKGHPTASATSGLFCAYNTGTTTISVRSGLLSASLPITVAAGEIGRPCGTVFRPGVNQVIVVHGQSQVTQTASSAGSPAPPPPPPAAAPIAAKLPKITLAAPPPAHVAVHAIAKPAVVHAAVPAPAPVLPVPVPVPSPVASAPPAAVPPPPPPAQPVPPGGTSTAQAAARRKEKARKHASQSAYTTRPAGSRGEDWFYPATGVVTVLALLLSAGGLRARPRPRPAWLGDDRPNDPPRRWQ